MLRDKTFACELRYADDKITLVWSHGERVFDRYYISADALNDRSRKIEATLSRLQAIRWKNWKCHPDDALPILRDLARDGAELYQAIFTGMEGKSASVRTAEEVRAYFENNLASKQPGTHRILIQHQKYKRALVPWGLTFTPLLEGQDTIEDLEFTPEHFTNFWCASFGLACTTETRIRPEETEKSSQRGNVRVVCVLKKEESVTRLIEEQPRMQASYDDTVAADRDMLSELIWRYPAHDQFFYFNMPRHSEKKGAFDLPRREGKRGQFDGLEAEEVYTQLRKVSRPEDRLVSLVLDGDAVLRSREGAIWVEECLKFGNAGLLAAETDIDNKDLKFAGWKIVRDVWLSRDTPLKAIETARTKHWPMSLLYGLYSDPADIVIDPEPLGLEQINYLIEGMRQQAAEEEL